MAPEAPKAQIIDLFEALKKSLAGAEANDDGVAVEGMAKPPKKTSETETETKKKPRAKKRSAG